MDSSYFVQKLKELLYQKKKVYLFFTHSLRVIV